MAKKKPNANLPPMEWIERVIRINSITTQSNEELVRFLLPLVKACGLSVAEQKVVENGQSFINLVAFNKAVDTKGLLVLNTHLDTVPAGRLEDWTKTKGNPFKATVVNDRVYGLGTADVKLDFLCKLWAIKHSKPWARPFALVGTYGEERGLVGAAQLLKSKQVKATYALVGEPSNLELIYAHKGHLVATIGIDLGVENVRFLSQPLAKKWVGTAAHSSTPQLGKNALKAGLDEIVSRRLGVVRLEAGTASNVIPGDCVADLVPQTTDGTRRLATLVKGLDTLSAVLKKKKDPRFTPSFTTVSFTLARTVGQEVLLTFDVRTLPGTDLNKIAERIKALAKKSSARIHSLTMDLPLRGEKNSVFVKHASGCLKSCGVKPVAKTKASSTEAALYDYYGASAIVFGPGISVGNVHRPNEYNLLSQMEVATQFYRAILMAETPGG